jgi:hypothetical protein
VVLIASTLIDHLDRGGAGMHAPGLYVFRCVDPAIAGARRLVPVYFETCLSVYIESWGTASNPVHEETFVQWRSAHNMDRIRKFDRAHIKIARFRGSSDLLRKISLDGESIRNTPIGCVGGTPSEHV